MLELKGRKVLVLGLGDTGLSMTRWLVRHGADVCVADTRDRPPHAIALARELPEIPVITGAFDGRIFCNADMIAISPGIDPRTPPIAEARRRGVPVVGDIELFARALGCLRDAACPRKPRVLAVTGSNGKSTVTAMTGELCRAGGFTTMVAGNIGTPALEALAAVEDGQPMPDVFVLELSSFQLESTSSLEPDAATVLNLCEDHMDRYDDLAQYAAAKARIFAGCGVQVLNRGDAWSMGMARAGRTVLTFGLDEPRTDSEWGIATTGKGRVLAQGSQELLPLAELPLPGLHNAANALASLALVHTLGMPVTPLVDALRRFQGLPHRVQKIAEIGGVAFYDDSKGTNVGATIAALAGLLRPVVLIAGGDGKGQDFRPLAAPVSAHARAVVLIGRDAEAIAAALSPCGVPLIRSGGMEEAVEAAFHAARAGDAVLLSPACASYDMFRSYVHRAEAFVAAVKKLQARKEHAGSQRCRD